MTKMKASLKAQGEQINRMPLWIEMDKANFKNLDVKLFGDMNIPK